MEESKSAQEKKVVEQDVENNYALGSDAASVGKRDILQLEHTDPVLNAKMHLVNNAIDEIGMLAWCWVT